MPTDGACVDAEISGAILGGSDIELHSESVSGEVLGYVARIHPEREPLAGLFQRRKEIPCAHEGARPRQDVAMNIGEQEAASCRCGGTLLQGRINSLSGQIVRDAFPEDECALRITVSGVTHGRYQVIVLEIDSDEPHVPGCRREHALQRVLFRHLGIRSSPGDARGGTRADSTAPENLAPTRGNASIVRRARRTRPTSSCSCLHSMAA